MGTEPSPAATALGRHQEQPQVPRRCRGRDTAGRTRCRLPWAPLRAPGAGWNQRSGSARHSQGVLAALSARASRLLQRGAALGRERRPRRDRSPAPPHRRGAATWPCPGSRPGAPRRAPPRREEEPPPAGSVRLRSALWEEAAPLLLRRRRRHPGGAPASGRPRRPRSHGLGGRAAAAARGLTRAGGGGGARPVPAEPGGAGWCRGTGAAGASGREGPGRGCPERRERGAGRGAAQLAIGL